MISNKAQENTNNSNQKYSKPSKRLMGCPFFNKELTDPQGKNITRGYPINYISKLHFLFKQSKKQQTIQPKQDYLNSLPYVIKHTLFLEQDKIKFMRECRDSAQIFFIADDTKIEGNEAYDQGNYYKALEIYEQVLGCYLWLDITQSETKKKVIEQFEEGLICDEVIKVEEKKIIIQEDTEIEKQTNESMIVGTLINSMLAYMSMFHFDEALKCINFILESFAQNPFLQYRKAQCLYFNKQADFKQLDEALYILDNFCLNSDSKDSQIKQYQELSEKIEKAQEELIQEQTKVVKLILKRSDRIIQQYKLKQNQTMDQEQLENNEMYQIIKIMNQKYSELVQFYRDNNNEIQLQKAIHEYQEFAKVYYQIQFCINLDINNLYERVYANFKKQKYVNVLNSDKLNLVVNEAKNDIIESIFFHANDINTELYQYSWQYYQDKLEKQKKRQKQRDKYKKSFGKNNEKEEKKPFYQKYEKQLIFSNIILIICLMVLTVYFKQIDMLNF